jgi:hypothetical protein
MYGFCGNRTLASTYSAKDAKAIDCVYNWLSGRLHTFSRVGMSVQGPLSNHTSGTLSREWILFGSRLEIVKIPSCPVGYGSSFDLYVALVLSPRRVLALFSQICHISTCSIVNRV